MRKSRVPPRSPPFRDWVLCPACQIADCVDRDGPYACMASFGPSADGYVHADSPKALDFREQCGGLVLPVLSGRPPPILPLPPFVPQVDDDHVSRSYIRPVMALPVDRFASSTATAFEHGTRVARKWKEQGAQAVLVVATGRDPFLETVWQHHEAWCDALARSSVDGSTAIAFSVYLDREPFENRIQTWRSIDSYRRLVDRGIPTSLPIGFTNSAGREATWTLRGEPEDSLGVSGSATPRRERG